MEGLRGLTGHQVVGVLRERYADEARAHAATLEAVWETVLCADADSTDRLCDPDEWSTDEVRAALGLTRAAANRLAGEAHQMFHRLPELGAAMAAGTLDPPRARVIADWTTELSDAHAHQVAAEILPHCRLDEQTRLTTGQLAEQIKVQAIALDPEWARRRYERSIADRKVMGSRTPDGTAKLSGTNLPLDRVAGSVARLDDLAKSAKRAGDPRPIDHLRAGPVPRHDRRHLPRPRRRPDPPGAPRCSGWIGIRPSSPGGARSTPSWRARRFINSAPASGGSRSRARPGTWSGPG